MKKKFAYLALCLFGFILLVVLPYLAFAQSGMGGSGSGLRVQGLSESEADNLYYRLDGTAPPTADINANSNEVINMAPGTSPSSGVSVVQMNASDDVVRVEFATADDVHTAAVYQASATFTRAQTDAVYQASAAYAEEQDVLQTQAVTDAYIDYVDDAVSAPVDYWLDVGSNSIYAATVAGSYNASILPPITNASRTITGATNGQYLWTWVFAEQSDDMGPGRYSGGFDLYKTGAKDVTVTWEGYQWTNGVVYQDVESGADSPNLASTVTHYEIPFVNTGLVTRLTNGLFGVKLRVASIGSPAPTITIRTGPSKLGHISTPNAGGVWATETYVDEATAVTAAQLLADPIQYTPYQLTSASTVTVSEAWTTNRFYLDLTNNVELAVSGVDTNKAAGWMLDVRLNSYSLSFGASITNLTNSDNFTRTNSYQSIVGNRPIFEAVTEVW